MSRLPAIKGRLHASVWDVNCAPTGCPPVCALQVTDFNLSRFLQDTVGSRNSSMAAMNPVRGLGSVAS